MRKDRVRNPGKIPRYEEVAGRIAYLVEEGTFRPGERVPSVRELSRQMQVSINTVMEAYTLLEDRRMIEARPQSGYYVCSRLPAVPNDPEIAKPDLRPINVSIGEIALMVLRDTQNPNLIQLGAAVPNPDLLPVDKLNRMLSAEARRFRTLSVSYSVPPGCERLRVQVAKRALGAGCTLRPDEIVITSGCVEAVALSLRAVCRPGDTVAIESPTYYNFLQLIQEMGLRALEIPSTPREGMSIEALRYALDQNSVRACLVITNFTNPLGSLMPDEKKRELVDLLAGREIPLIEDDIYGDLSFADERPSVAKSYDKKGLVLLCSSFSKTLAPGYRVGWIAAGKFQPEIERLKVLTNIATASPPQLAIAEFLANGGYDHHLRSMRRAYARQVALMGDAIGRFFPTGTRVTRPAGSSVLWVEMPESVDALALYEKALLAGITFAPGALFSATGKYRNYLRLNATFWGEKVERAVETLGRLAGEMVRV